MLLIAEIAEWVETAHDLYQMRARRQPQHQPFGLVYVANYQISDPEPVEASNRSWREQYRTARPTPNASSAQAAPHYE